MYIERRNLHEIPSDAILLSEKEVINYYYENIFKIMDKKITWPFTYGLAGSNIVAFGTNWLIMSYFRSRLRLQNRAKIISGIVFVGIPSMFSYFYHIQYIQPEIFLQKRCITCVHMKAIIFQNLFGVGYSMTGGALISMMTAYMNFTYPVPGFLNKEELKGSLKLYMKFIKRIPLKILVFILLNSATITLITNAEYKNFAKLNEILRRQDEHLRDLVTQYNS
ncbi:hypothetical protein PGB90_004780 [Kerria lacca]